MFGGRLALWIWIGGICGIIAHLPLPVDAQSKFDIGQNSENTQQDSDDITSYRKIVDLNTVVWEIDINPRPTISDAQLAESLADRGRRYLSGKLHGYQFRYQPEHEERDVVERFQADLIAEIERDDAQFMPVSIWKRGEQLYGQFQYRVAGDQLAWLAAWENSPTVTGGGRGEATLWTSDDDQTAAVHSALLDAVRRYVRREYRNTPQLVYGKLLLNDGPRIWIRDGAYQAELFTRIRIDNVEEYRFN